MPLAADLREHRGVGKPRSLNMTPRLRAALRELGGPDPTRSARVLNPQTREWLEAVHLRELRRTTPGAVAMQPAPCDAFGSTPTARAKSRSRVRPVTW